MALKHSEATFGEEISLFGCKCGKNICLDTGDQSAAINRITALGWVMDEAGELQCPKCQAANELEKFLARLKGEYDLYSRLVHSTDQELRADMKDSDYDAVLSGKHDGQWCLEMYRARCRGRMIASGNHHSELRALLNLLKSTRTCRVCGCTADALLDNLEQATNALTAMGCLLLRGLSPAEDEVN